MRLGALFLCMALLSGHAFAANRAIDGDTIEIDGERIRLENVDTPEVKGKCDAERMLAQVAKSFTQAAIDRGPITIQRIARKDQYGRSIAWVKIDGQDLGQMLIDAGLARKWTGKRRSWCD
jgi:endonuclease YncB( thermonuclease family)